MYSQLKRERHTHTHTHTCAILPLDWLGILNIQSSSTQRSRILRGFRLCPWLTSCHARTKLTHRHGTEHVGHAQISLTHLQLDMFDMDCCAQHCLKTLFWEKEKGLTFSVDQSSCALSTQELVCRYVYTACTEASSLAGDFCDALQPPANLMTKNLCQQVVHTHTPLCGVAFFGVCRRMYLVV